MKISKIELIDYQQFKNVELNLTYPLGHKKVGKPLDKICFIGQSGTGKTTVLRLIKYFVSLNRRIGPNFFINKPNEDSVFFELNEGDLFSRMTIDEESFILTKQEYKGKSVTFEKYVELSENYQSKIKPLLINYPAEFIRGKKELESIEPREKIEERIKQKLNFITTLEPTKIVDFAIQEIEHVRDYVFKEIKEYRAKELILKTEISDQILKQGTTPKDLIELNQRFENWFKENPDPLKKLAEECLNPIINKFGLKVKTKIDLETILEIGDIQLETLTGDDVDRNFWSTGTRHIVDTVLPIFELKPKNAVILMDEPEKSLFPDIQEMAIDFYTNLAPDCQFFFATHSPIIASSFDPWEVFHLEYDKENKKVQVVENFTGERHIDNYKYYPKYLRWDSVLKNVFKVTDEGNNERESTLLDLAILKRDIEKMVEDKKQNSLGFKKKKAEFLKLSKKVGWDEKTF